MGNHTSGNDDLLWKNEQGGNIGIETTGAGKFQVDADTELADLLTVPRIRSHADLTASGGGAIAMGVEASGDGVTTLSASGEGSSVHGRAEAATEETVAQITTSDKFGAYTRGWARAGMATSRNAQILASEHGATAIGVADANAAGGVADAAILASGFGSFAMGHAVTTGEAGVIISAAGKGSFAGGWANDGNVYTIGNASLAFGENVATNNANSYAFGKDFINDTASTFMVGFGAGDFVISATELLYTGTTKLGDGGSTDYTETNATGDVTMVGTGRTLESAKFKLTAIGGFAIKLTNETGANTIAGQLVRADTGTDDAVILAPAGATECIGVFLDSGIADAAKAWVVVAGIADVAMQDNTTATRGNWVQTSDTEAGYAIATAGSPAAAPAHFEEIGNCIETVTATGGGTHVVARCVLHFL